MTLKKDRCQFWMFNDKVFLRGKSYSSQLENHINPATPAFLVPSTQMGCNAGCSVTCMYVILRNVRYEAFHVCREYTHLNSQSLCCNKQAWLCKVTSIAEALGAIEWFKCQYKLSQLHYKTLQETTATVETKWWSCQTVTTASLM